MTNRPARLGILIVDDDDLFRSVFVRGLRSSATVFVAASVQEAGEILQVEAVDVMITDYDLGRGAPTGLSLLRRLREESPQVRRFLMTGALPPDEELEDGLVEAVLIKPFAFREFLVLLLRS